MKWSSAFQYVPINYDDTVAEVCGMTQQVCFDNNLAGDRIRLHLTNRYGKRPLHITAASVGVESAEGVVSAVPVTLHGCGEILLEAGQELFSDEAALTVRPGERLAVTLYFGDRQALESVCCFWSRTNASVRFGYGDHTDGSLFSDTAPENVLPLIREDPSPFPTVYFGGFDAVQVYTEDSVKVIAAFGDSITHMSFVTNALMKRLYAAYPGQVTLLNCGIGGNRLVHDATRIKAIDAVAPVFGDAGVTRFERDVFSLQHVDTVLALIGINDIMHPVQLEELDATTDAQEILQGYRQIAGIARAHGAAIFGATVTPCGNETYPAYWLPLFEKTRAALNAWIRSGSEGCYDGYFDYDAAVRDDEKPGFLLPAVHIGDGLHPNDLGGSMIAASVDLVRLTGLPETPAPAQAAAIPSMPGCASVQQPADVTAQPLAFDPVLPPAGTPDPLVRDAEGNIWLQIDAPQARQLRMQLDLDTYDMHRDSRGIWILRLPFTGGIRYIHLYADGMLFLSPYLPIAYGYSRPCNYIALEGDSDEDFRLRNVPHGRLVRDWFFSSVTDSWESCLVYTPPQYEEEPEKTFPVLYLQHGHGENETGWASSGKLPFLLDNLIARDACVPFVAVMNNGMVQTERDGRRIVDFSLFDRYLLEDVIPFIEQRYRAGGSKTLRAMAGLSMGSLQTSMSGLRHPELFSSLGIFSGFMHDWITGSELDMVSRGPGADDHLATLKDPQKVNDSFSLLFRAIGDEDPFLPYFLADDRRCEGVRQVRKIYRGTHDWNVWRLCLRDFAQLLFKGDRL